MPDTAKPTEKDLDLSEIFAAVESKVSSSRSLIETEAQKAASVNILRMGRDRSWIATTIIVTYGLAILGVILYVMFSVPACTGPADVCQTLSATWDKQAALLSDIVVTAVLPVVTLMLGFYFGTENTRAAGRAPE